MYNKVHQKKYYETHKDECVARVVRRQVERYNTDPEFKEKMKARQAEYRLKRKLLKEQGGLTDVSGGENSE